MSLLVIKFLPISRSCKGQCSAGAKVTALLHEFALGMQPNPGVAAHLFMKAVNTIAWNPHSIWL
jgi:hypothetical protein